MRIVLVEDSLTVQQLIVERLEAENGLVVSGLARSAVEAVELVLATRPDVVLLDLHLASGSGLDVLAQLRRQRFAGRIYILSADEQAALGALCLAHGADGSFDKSDIDTLIKTLIKTLDGAPARRL